MLASKNYLVRALEFLMPFLAALAALATGAVVIWILGASPSEAFAALLKGAFGSKNAVAESLVKATPLLLVGLGICIAFRGGMINIGGEGQILTGAISATFVGLALPEASAWMAIPLCMAAGFIAGAIWGAIPGTLKAYFNVNEILSTIMMNQIAVQGINYLLRGPLLDPAQSKAATKIPETARMAHALDLPRMAPTRLHLGAAIAVVLAILVYIFLWRTTLGYRIRAVGLNPHASRYAGINVKNYLVLSLTLSGAFAGLGGAIQILGLHHRMFTDGSALGFTSGAGFDGIVAALFGQLHPLGTIPAAALFGALLVGANKMQRVVQVPSALITALNGLVVVFVVSSEIWRRRRAQNQVEETRDIGYSDQNGASHGQLPAAGVES